ncbi:hypothetical protein BD769DRAFT_183575 [Suillus cothurnatus]|nr:hypothetical protein BD769DRAFT_183575 [Suillus cothurnatus]
MLLYTRSRTLSLTSLVISSVHDYLGSGSIYSPTRFTFEVLILAYNWLLRGSSRRGPPHCGLHHVRCPLSFQQSATQGRHSPIRGRTCLYFAFSRSHQPGRSFYPTKVITNYMAVYRVQLSCTWFIRFYTNPMVPETCVFVIPGRKGTCSLAMVRCHVLLTTYSNPAAPSCML